MPKLDGTQIGERLEKRLAELQAGKEVAAKDIRALLTDKQQEDLDAAWAVQQQLRKLSRARTEEKQKALGWVTKNELRIAAFKAAIKEANDGELRAWKKRAFDAQVRQGRIYLESLFAAENQGKTPHERKNFANNELTRAGLRRLDGGNVSSITKRESRRDMEVWAMEDALRVSFKKDMTPEELEQLEWDERNAKDSKKTGV